jgi:type II secretory pathway component PulF
MSELYLFERPQDYGWAHADPLMVVAARHHFRIWRAPFKVGGRTVWAGAGTHDVGFDKDQRNGKITHKIDPNTDGERDYIGKSLEDMGYPLPWFTQILMTVGVFLRDHALAVGVAAMVVVTVVVALRKVALEAVSRASRRVPLLRDVVLTQESARFFTVMAAMVRSGVTLSDALGVAVNALSHPLLKSQLSVLRTKLIEGGNLRTLIDTVSALPLPTRRLLMAAERSGDLDSAFETLAGDMTEELERRSERLLAAMEPLLIVFMFLMIGSLVVSIMVPLMQATSGAMR